MLIENFINDKGEIVERDKVKIAIDRLKTFEPEEGYYLCFSGGKDSQCIYHIAKESGVKFDAHYNHTTRDYPELIYFMRRNYPDVLVDYPKTTMRKLIIKNGMPTRLHRFCCAELKEHGGEGRLCITGVRWEESNARSKRKPFETITPKFSDKMLFNDNEENRRLFENCSKKGKRIVNPIIEWTENDVWEYLNTRGIEHCILYDKGYDRLGCIGCPMGRKQRIKQYEDYPKFFEADLKALRLYMVGYLQRKQKKGLEPKFRTAEEMMKWWLSDNEDDSSDSYENQIDMEGEMMDGMEDEE